MAKIKNFLSDYREKLKTDKSTDTHVSAKESLSFALSGFGKNSFSVIIGSTTYLNMFLTLALGMDVMAVGVLLSVYTIIGYVRGPIISLLEDSTKSRWGRFRPYFIVCAPLAGIMAILFFINPFSGNGQTNTIWVYATYILYGVSMGFADVAWAGITKCFAQDPGERGSAFSISKGFNIVSTVVPSWLPLAIQYGPKLGLSIRMVFVIMACFMGIVGLLAVSCAKNIRERVMIKKVEKPWKTIGMVFKNKNKMLMWLSSLGSIFNYVSNMAFPYVLMYCYGAYGLQTFIWGVAGIFAWITLFLSKRVLKRFSPKTIIYLYHGMSAFADIVLLFIGFGTGFWYIFALFATRAFAAIFEYVCSVATDMFETDVWDHFEWKYGIRNESTTDMVGGWVVAPISIVSPLVYAWLFTKIGFQSGEDAVQTTQTIQWLFYFALGGAAISKLFSCIPYMLIRLDRKTMEKVRTDLVVRRAKISQENALAENASIEATADSSGKSSQTAEVIRPSGFFVIDYKNRQGHLENPVNE